ncbi:hypothetical protein GCM10020358_09420 [Amorphoplanes nipponensis]|uniref:ABC transporter permease n=1 Tax=Actinoplanes nipponensis TaxID=135950 RepID=UPI0031F08725
MTTDERPAVAERTRPLPHPVRTLTVHALRGFARSPLSAFFTLIFPLAFLVIVSAIVGNGPTGAGVPVAQFLVAPFAVFGVAQATFVVLATDTAGLRERGVLMRLCGTPAPAWTVLAARVSASAVVSVAAVVLLTGVGAGLYGVEVVWRKIPALLVTLALGIACFSALGLAVVALTRTVLVAQTLTQGLLIPLAFISDVFIVGAELPVWLDRLGTALPLRHFAHAMTETFDPAGGTGSGRATCWCWRPGACSARSWPSGVSAGCRAARRRPRRPRPLRRRRRPGRPGPRRARSEPAGARRRRCWPARSGTR